MIIQKLISRLQRILHKWFPNKSPLANWLWKYREAQIITDVLTLQGKALLVVGDSRFHQFEEQFADAGYTCRAVSGSKLDEWIERLLKWAIILKPKAIITDAGGNNFLSGEFLDDVCDKKELYTHFA